MKWLTNITKEKFREIYEDRKDEADFAFFDEPEPTETFTEKQLKDAGFGSAWRI